MTYNPWITCGIGIFFCISGIYFFFRNVFEENKTITGAVLIMIMGIILVSVASFQLMYLTR